MDSCAVCATFRHKRFFHAKEARVNGCIESEWLPRVKDKRHACHWCCLSSPSKRTFTTAKARAKMGRAYPEPAALHEPQIKEVIITVQRY